MVIIKNRNAKEKEYLEKYSDIPKDREERLGYMYDMYNLNEKKALEIISKKRSIEYNLCYEDFLIVLYEEPEGFKRHRFRIITKSNYVQAAIINPQFVHVYSPNASDDFRFMKRLVGEELVELDRFIQTPCIIEYNAYFKTPSYFNVSDKFISEIGLHRNAIAPDWDNIGKKYCDMYNHNIWLDDSLVVSGTVNKFYSILPRVEIRLRYLNYATNKFQYNNIIGRKEYRKEYPINYLNKLGEVNQNE